MLQIAVRIGHREHELPAGLEEGDARRDEPADVRHVLEHLECAHRVEPPRQALCDFLDRPAVDPESAGGCPRGGRRVELNARCADAWIARAEHLEELARATSDLQHIAAPVEVADRAPEIPSIVRVVPLDLLERFVERVRSGEGRRMEEAQVARGTPIKEDLAFRGEMRVELDAELLAPFRAQRRDVDSRDHLERRARGEGACGRPEGRITKRGRRVRHR
jgi:hypothetical protein